MKTFIPKAILLDFYGTVVEEYDHYIAAICQQIASASRLGASSAEVGGYWGKTFKPRADMFLQGLYLLGLKAELVLHVGDSIGSDVQGAAALHIPVMWINRKNRPVRGGWTPDYVAIDLMEVVTILQANA